MTTVRFFVKDTFEEVSQSIPSDRLMHGPTYKYEGCNKQRVLELQQSKKKLEGLLVAPQAEAGSYDGLSSLEASGAAVNVMPPA